MAAMLAVHTSFLGPPIPLEHHFDLPPPLPALEQMYDKECEDMRMEYKPTLFHVGSGNALEKATNFQPPPVRAMDMSECSSVSKGLLADCPRLPAVISKSVPAGLYRLPTADGFAFAMVENEDDDSESDCEDFFDEEDESDWENEPESTSQLLNFAAVATTDIQRYFGRNRGNEDFCDVFEDKFKTMKSGRELYYADLLALAQFGDNTDIKLNCKNSNFKNSVAKSVEVHEPSHTIYTSQGNPVPCHLPHLGRLQSHVGLGPFQELFDSVLRDSLIKDEVKPRENPVVGKHLDPTECAHKIDTLWDEPVTIASLRGMPQQAPSSTLDFSDLLARWTADGSTYN